MAELTITVHALNGNKLQISTKPSEQVSNVRQQVEEAVGVGELEEVRLYVGTEELHDDTQVSTCLLDCNACCQAVITKSPRKAMESVRLHHPVLPSFKSPPPHLPFTSSLQPFVAPNPKYSWFTPSLETKKCIQALDVLSEMSYGAKGIPLEDLHDLKQLSVGGVLSGGDRHNKTTSDPLHKWVVSMAAIVCLQYHDKQAVSDTLLGQKETWRGCYWLHEAVYYPCDEFAAVLANFFAVVARHFDATTKSETTRFMEQWLCRFASEYPVPHARAAAVKAIIDIWGGKYLAELAQVAHRDPDASVRGVATTFLKAVHSKVQGHAPGSPPPYPTCRSPSPPGVATPLAPAPAPGAVVALSQAQSPGATNLKTEEDGKEEAKMQEALRQSEKEDLQREGRDVQEALLRSKADAWSADGVKLLRLTFHSPEMAAVLRTSSTLADCRARVESAGCEVSPAWANGALLLVPVTEEQISEADLQLKSHNILMLTSDVPLVEQVLGQLPRRKRPQLKPEHLPEAKAAASATELVEGCTIDAEKTPPPLACRQVGTWMQDVGLVVEHTFLSFPLAKDVSDASTIVQSEPANGASSSTHVNPHRWRLTARDD